MLEGIKNLFRKPRYSRMLKHHYLYITPPLPATVFGSAQEVADRLVLAYHEIMESHFVNLKLPEHSRLEALLLVRT